MNHPHRCVDAKRALEGVPSIDVRDFCLGNVGTIQEHIRRSGQQMIITGVLHCTLFKAISKEIPCVIARVSHLEVSNGGLSWGSNVRYSGFQRKTSHKNLVRFSICRDSSLPLDSISNRQRALANNPSRRGKALSRLWDVGRCHYSNSRLVFLDGLDGETLGSRNPSIENISGRCAEDEICVVPDFTG